MAVGHQNVYPIIVEFVGRCLNIGGKKALGVTVGIDAPGKVIFTASYLHFWSYMDNRGKVAKYRFVEPPGSCYKKTAFWVPRQKTRSERCSFWLSDAGHTKKFEVEHN